MGLLNGLKRATGAAAGAALGPRAGAYLSGQPVPPSRRERDAARAAEIGPEAFAAEQAARDAARAADRERRMAKFNDVMSMFNSSTGGSGAGSAGGNGGSAGGGPNPDRLAAALGGGFAAGGSAPAPAQGHCPGCNCGRPSHAVDAGGHAAPGFAGGGPNPDRLAAALGGGPGGNNGGRPMPRVW